MKKIFTILVLFGSAYLFGQNYDSSFKNIDPEKGYSINLLENGQSNFPELILHRHGKALPPGVLPGKPYYTFSVVTYDGTGVIHELIMGIDTYASDEIDSAYNEVALTGAPVPGIFDSRLYLPDGFTSAMVDYREGDNHTTEARTYHLKWQLGENSKGFAMIIAMPRIGGYVDLTISDKFNGEYLYENVKVGVTNIEIINPEITELFLTANYISSLPVEFTTFTASVIKNGVKLVWQTASELNNSGFEIEKSTDNKNFEKIGFVEGNGTSTEIHNYDFTDRNLSSGTSYYRLRQVDFDGSYDYSEVVEVEYMPTQYSLGQNYPNPFNPSTKIKFALPVESKVTITMYNMLGQKVQEVVNGVMNAGLQEVVLNAGELSSGMYLYNITAQGTDGSTFTATKKMMLMK